MLIEKVKETIGKYRMLDKKDKVLVAVSGGADSVCLLYVLNFLKEEFDLNLHIAHLNHILRGLESDEDEKFVKNLSAKLDIPITIDRINIKKISKKASLEQEARKIRYDFLINVAETQNATKVAIGHTLDDQIETFLMRLVRGTGMNGLRGIPEVRYVDNLMIIRPLIEVWRREVEEFLEKNSIVFREDSSNYSPEYLRNRIRHNLLPLLSKEYNPNIKNLLVRLCDNINLADDFLSVYARRKFKATVKIENSKGCLDLKRFYKYHPYIKREVLRYIIKEINGNLRKITFQHLVELEQLIKIRPNGSVVDLPDNLVAKKDGREIIFLKRRIR